MNLNCLIIRYNFATTDNFRTEIAHSTNCIIIITQTFYILARSTGRSEIDFPFFLFSTIYYAIEGFHKELWIVVSKYEHGGD